MSRPIIVCVDDEMMILSSLKEQLRRGLGDACAIELASIGEEALQLLAELADEGADVQLLISDHIMPGMHGADLLTRAHHHYPGVLKILLTGQADTAAVGQAVNQANLYRFLAKPWQEADLILTAKEALRRVAQERELAQRNVEIAHSHDRLKQSMELLHATMDATRAGLLVLDHDATPVQVNQQLVDMWAVPEALVRPVPVVGLLAHLRSRLKYPAAIRLDALQEAEAPMLLELVDGRVIEYLSRAHRLHGEPIGMVYSFQDVTENHRNVSLIRHQASHDRVSGLPNRYQFDERLAQAIARARAARSGLAVLFIDLDHFKHVNDTLGHDVGDQMLRCVAERLLGCLREGDLIARWGGDEFTVLLHRTHTHNEAIAVAQRMLEALRSPAQLGEHAVQVGASIGMAMYPADGTDGEALLKHADMALYQAKLQGRDRFVAYDAQTCHAQDGRAEDPASESLGD